MSTTPNIDLLREQVTALKALLDDPQPGLASWVEFYGQRMQALSDFWNADAQQQDKIRLDRLSDPKFKFGYKIRASGEVVIEDPCSALAGSLRAGIDHVRAVVKEIPFCPTCRKVVIDGDGKRWRCSGCDTIFNWSRKV